MRSGAVVLGLLAGCGFHAPAAQDGPGGGGDMSGSGCMSFSSQVDTCSLTLDTDLTLTGHITYDTATHELRVEGAVTTVAHMTLPAKAGDVDAILARNVHITSGSGLTATGLRSFAIIASGSVTLDDTAEIDVGHGGAGALGVCSTPPHAGGPDPGGAGGGGGGAYGDAGGNGGAGNHNVSTGGAGGGSITMPDGPLGGCPGAAGGRGGAGVAAAGGHGGGALFIVAADRIELGDMAVLTAGGGGGRGGNQTGGSADGGGGGGGAGGMIFLEAPHVIGPNALVAANGGGGGQGGDGGAAGNNGQDGLTLASGAAGGTGGAVNGSDGGRGGSRGQTAGDNVTTSVSGAGGGGGGSVGYIHVVSSDMQLGSVSPPASQVTL
jgi:hypothetical protein